MAQIYRESALVLGREQLADGVFSLRLQTERIAAECAPGQFVSVYCADSSRLLPRPISVCEADPEKGILRLGFRVAGKGTKEFSGLEKGDKLTLTGPLGNGFPLEKLAGRKVLLAGGGIGIPPMLQLAKALSGGENQASELTAAAGFRDCLFLTEDFAPYCRVLIATEDGSAGTKGTVLDAMLENGASPDVICACGPAPMLRALKQYAAEKGIACWLSLEEKMACGVGACLSCVCRSAEVDEHSRVKNKRVCTEGPVFAAEEVEL